MGPWLHEIHVPALVLTGELDGGCNPRLNKQIASGYAQSGQAPNDLLISATS